MIDVHRHIPSDGEKPLPTDLPIWFATSSVDEWEADKHTMQSGRWRFGYGVLFDSNRQQELAENEWDSLLDRLSDKLVNNPLGYVGEIGIDERFFGQWPQEQQFSLAVRLLELARSMRRVAVLHHVGPTPLLERLLDTVVPSAPVIIHGFLGSVETARHLADLGATISIGTAIWAHPTKLSRRLGELDVPFLLETDYPHMSTPPAQRYTYTGLLHEHLVQVAALRGCPPHALEEELDGFATLLAHQPAAR